MSNHKPFYLNLLAQLDYNLQVINNKAGTFIIYGSYSMLYHFKVVRSLIL